MIQRRPETDYVFALVGAPAGVAGALTFQLERADGTTAIAASGTGIVETEAGQYLVEKELPDTLGVYQAIWKHGVTVIGDPELIEVTYSTPAAPSAGLITRDEVKARLNITGTDQDDHIDGLLPGVVRIIERVTSREFSLVATGNPSDRTYFYDGSGVLEIGDCVTVDSVEFEGSTVSADTYLIEPQDELEPVYYWLEFAPSRAISPEMGFMYNLDRLWPKYRAGRRLTQVTVSADWGWPYIPEDIKLAASWLVSEGLDRTRSSGVTAESIDSYSVSFGQSEQAQMALPARVNELLESYRRVNI